jgi:ABC-type transport system substrate-binding protein
MQNYWNRILAKRISRRRGVVATGLAAGAAAFLAACGGSKDSSTGSDLVHKPEDTTGKAVNGGTFIGQAQADPNSFDVLLSQPADAAMASRAYSRLLKYKASKYPAPIEPLVEADAASSWEYSPDGLRVVYKLRPNMKFDSRPPTNGRAVTAQDAKASFERFMKVSVNRAIFDNSLDPTAPVKSVEAVDDKTFAVNLAFPYAPFDSLVAQAGYISVLPAEAGTSYDLKNTLRGSGAWRLETYQASSRYEFVKNKDWYDAAKVHLDGMNLVILPDPATNRAQFLAGNLWYTDNFPRDDVLLTKKDRPQLEMFAQESFSAGDHWLRFGYLPESPFFDERVRKAASMSINRDLFVDTFGNADRYEAEGIDIPRRWNSSLPAGESFWIDPKDESVYGKSAAFYKYDPAEAKKLIQAAGLQAPVSSTFHWPVPVTPTTFEREMQVIQGMWEETGNFKMALRTYTNYPAEFLGPFVNGNNRWNGIAANLSGSRAEVDALLFEYLYYNGRRAGHVGADGKPDATLQGLIEQQRVERDVKKRASIVADIQRHVSTHMYFMWNPGQALGFDLVQPWLQNFRLWRSRPGGSQDQEGNIYWWYDEKKKT